jgi:DNA-binding transcriptional LysR family regulator
MADLPDPRADVDDLRAFVAVARQGSVGRAAQLLGRTQPTVSARLSALEAVWKTRLFRREARGMAPTPEGVRLLPLAEAALRQLEEIDEAAGLPLTTGRTLRIGAGDALGREVLPRALVRLLRGHPDIDVYLREGPGPRLLQDLRDGEIDLALVVLQAEPLEGIDVEPCLSTDVHLLAPKGSLRLGARAPSLRALAGRRWVSLQSGSGFRSHV